MANRERGQARITVDGRDYTLHLTINARCELEDRLSTADKPVTFRDVMKDVNSGSQRAVRAFLWACLFEHHGDEFASPKDAGKLIDAAGGVDVVMGALLDTVKASEPFPDDVKALQQGGKPANPPNAQRSGTGMRSTEPVTAPA